MGILTDFVLADEGEGGAIGKADRPSESWKCLEGWKGVETIKLATLFLIASGREPTVEETVDESAEFELAGGDKEEGPWVFRFPPKVVSAIASIPNAQLPAVASAWCETEELHMDRWSLSEAEQFIAQLQELLQQAISSEKSVFLWLCL